MSQACTFRSRLRNSLPDRLLTMTWLDGVPLLELVDAELEMRNRVAENMFRAWYVPFYYYGTIHGDPHLGIIARGRFS